MGCISLCIQQHSLILDCDLILCIIPGLLDQRRSRNFIISTCPNKLYHFVYFLINCIILYTLWSTTANSAYIQRVTCVHELVKYIEVYKFLIGPVEAI
jgi:hypothetical protein